MERLFFRVDCFAPCLEVSPLSRSVVIPTLAYQSNLTEEKLTEWHPL